MVQDDAGSNEEQHGNEHSSNDQWLTRLRETRDGGAGGQNKNETLGGRRNTITHRHNFCRRKLSFRLLFPRGYLLMKPTPPAPWVFSRGQRLTSNPPTASVARHPHSQWRSPQR